MPASLDVRRVHGEQRWRIKDPGAEKPRVRGCGESAGGHRVDTGLDYAHRALVCNRTPTGLKTQTHRLHQPPEKPYVIPATRRGREDVRDVGQGGRRRWGRARASWGPM